MRPAEQGIYDLIRHSRAANDKISDDEVLDWALGLGQDLSVPEERVVEIFEAAKRDAAADQTRL